MPFYAVASGRKPGIYDTWEECCIQVHKFKSAKFKKFKTEEEAKKYVIDNKPTKNINNSNKLDNKVKLIENQLNNQSTTSSGKDLIIANNPLSNLIRTAQLLALEAEKFVKNNQKSGLKSASSLESVIVDKVINKNSSNKRNLTTNQNEETIILSDDEQSNSPKSFDQIESDSIIILDDDLSLKSLNIKSINNDNKINNSKIATRSSPRIPIKSNEYKLTNNKKINNENNKNQSQVNPFFNNLDFISINSSNNNNQIVNQSNSNRINKGHVVVYTDGACSNNGYKNARAGIGVWWGKDDKRNISEPLAGRATNNRAEIWAAIRAINKAADDGYDSVQVCTDSDFLIKSAKHWVYKWKKNDWHLSNNKKVANKDDFIELIKAMDRIKVVWEKVKSHIGIPGNEAADRLAVEGMNKQV